MQSILIRDTTRAQREQIVRQGLAACGSSCEGCNGCDNLGGGRVDTFYQPYIDGEKELWELNAEYRRGSFGKSAQKCPPHGPLRPVRGAQY